MATKDKILRILVVDDNRDGADTLGLLLEELGNKVHVTYGGSNALAVATSFSPDLMLVDLVMPEMDGCGFGAAATNDSHVCSHTTRRHNRPGE